MTQRRQLLSLCISALLMAHATASKADDLDPSHHYNSSNETPTAEEPAADPDDFVPQASDQPRASLSLTVVLPNGDPDKAKDVLAIYSKLLCRARFPWVAQKCHTTRLDHALKELHIIADSPSEIAALYVDEAALARANNIAYDYPVIEADFTLTVCQPSQLIETGERIADTISEIDKTEDCSKLPQTNASIPDDITLQKLKLIRKIMLTQDSHQNIPKDDPELEHAPQLKDSDLHGLETKPLVPSQTKHGIPRNTVSAEPHFIPRSLSQDDDIPN